MYFTALSSIHRQYLAAFSCQLSVMMVGSCFAWFSPILAQLTSQDSDIKMTSTQSSWLVASIEVGEIISPIPAGILVNRWGRKTTLLTSFPLVAVSWILVFSYKSYEVLLTVRFLQGFAMGIVFTVAPIYLAEISQPSIRGALCGHFQTFWVLGILYSFISGSFLNYQHHAIAGSIISWLFLITFIFAPESPHYLLMKNKEEKATQSLNKLRSNDDITKEINSIKSSLDGEKYHKKARWKDLITKDNRRALVVVTSVCFVKYMSGSSAITQYLTYTVANTTRDDINQNMITIIIGSVMLLASLSSAYMSDILGRRPLVFVSVVGAILLNAITGTYFLLFQLQTYNIERYSWVPYTSIGFYCIVANIGLSPLLQTLQAECFPSRLRGHAGALISFIGTIVIFLSLKQYQPVSDWAGIYLNFFLFSLYSFLGSLLIFPFMKETAGKTLEEIQSNKKNKINNDLELNNVNREVSNY